MATTQEQRLATLEWRRKDISEALVNAVGLGDIRGVKKYTAQLEKTMQEISISSRLGMKRFRRTLTRSGPSDNYMRGKKGLPSAGDRLLIHWKSTKPTRAPSVVDLELLRHATTRDDLRAAGLPQAVIERLSRDVSGGLLANARDIAMEFLRHVRIGTFG